MRRDELEAWLRDNDKGTVTDEQAAVLLAAADEIEARHPEASPERAGAFEAAHFLMFNGSAIVVDVLANRLRKARQVEAEALAGLQQAALTVIQPDGRDVESEYGFAKYSGIDRMTVRKWLGKR